MDSDSYYSNINLNKAYIYIKTHVKLEDKNDKYKRNYFRLYK